MRFFEEVDRKFIKIPEVETKLPARGTRGSAGHDFYLKEKIHLYPNERKTTYLDVKVFMPEFEYLGVYIRSSIARKKGVLLLTSVSIIDSDYYDNEETGGNIAITLWNMSDKEVEFKVGERIAQGIFQNYFITNDDEPMSEKRVGESGSTGK